MAHKIVQSNGSVQFTDDVTKAGFPVQPVISGSVTVRHEQFGPVTQTTIRLDNVAQAVVNGTEYQSNKIYSFPQALRGGCRRAHPHERAGRDGYLAAKDHQRG